MVRKWAGNVMKNFASLSMDLDNLWTYLKIHGDPEWKNFPSFFEQLTPLILEFLKRHNIKTTFFVVGQDAVVEKNAYWLKRIAEEGHEFGNHSFDHEPWMEQRSDNEIAAELMKSHHAILNATGQAPIGFRGPGFCCNQGILEAVRELNYGFDASLFPTVIAPLARLYYLLTIKSLNEGEKSKRKQLFGSMSNGLKTLKPFKWSLPSGDLLEIPVTTIPLLRIPFHLSYIIWLSKFSKKGALHYFNFALKLCKIRHIEPSLLLHPLDFLGKEDAPGLSFFPGMDLTREHKLEIADLAISSFADQFKVLNMSQHAAEILRRGV